MGGWKKLLQGKHSFWGRTRIPHPHRERQEENCSGLVILYLAFFTFILFLFYFDGHAKLLADVWILVLIIECVKSASCSHLLGLCFLSPV